MQSSALRRCRSSIRSSSSAALKVEGLFVNSAIGEEIVKDAGVLSCIRVEHHEDVLRTSSQAFGEVVLDARGARYARRRELLSTAKDNAIIVNVKDTRGKEGRNNLRDLVASERSPDTANGFRSGWVGRVTSCGSRLSASQGGESGSNECVSYREHF